MAEQIAMFANLPKGGGDKLVLRDLKLREHTAIVPRHFQLVQSDAQMMNLRKTLEKADLFAFDTETTGLAWDDRAVAIGISVGDRAWMIPTDMVHAMRNWDVHEIAEHLRDVFESDRIAKVAHNLKFDMRHMKNTYGIEVGGRHHDTALAQWILNENERHDLETICTTYLGHDDWKIKQDGSFNVWPLKMATIYLCHDAEATYELYHFQVKHLEQLPKLRALMYDVEMPTMEIAYDAEQRGFAWDANYYRDVMKPEVDRQVREAEEGVREYLGPNINLASPEQVAMGLFTGLKLKPYNGNSVDKKTLSALRNVHPVIPRLERHRKYTTLKKMFIDKLPDHVHNGRIHVTLKTIGAKTGRMACVEPNLQQLPKQTVGPLVRRGFIPTYGCVLVTMDYSQIELRILAHLSNDNALIESFRRGDDIHMAVTSRMFGIPMEELKADKGRLQENPQYVTLRVIAKTINFGILYGMGPSLLMETINDRVRVEDQITLKRAQQLIDEWYAAYPMVHKYIYKMQGLAFRDGYVETILGRKRRLPDARSKDSQLKAYAERQAGNAPIQGSAADIIKVAAIRVRDLIRERNWPYHLLLQVHDELIMEVPIAWLKRNNGTLAVIQQAMRDAVPLIVPTEVSLEVLTRWGDRYIEDDDDILMEAM